MESIRLSNAAGTISNDIFAQVTLANEAIYPLLEKRRAQIENVARKTFRYGALPGSEMDVYYPSTTPSGKAPVLAFVYGGGYVHGSKTSPPPGDLIYKNVGVFYASQGFVTVIPDYRKLPDMKWPDAPSDIASALTFLVTHSSDVNASAPTAADVQNIFLVGHSAGGAIASDVLLAPGLLPANVRRSVRGLIVFGGMMHYRGLEYPIPPFVLRGYYGTDEDVRAHEPLGLLEAAADEIVRGLPDVLMVVSEHDVAAMRTSVTDFRSALAERTGKDVPLLVAQGHNHISPHYALSSGEGEEWGHDVVRWMRAKLASSNGKPATE